jgi:hypothetical protein
MLEPNSNLHGDALAFLLLVLYQNRTNTKAELSPDTVNALIPHLVVLASAHPSSSTRHQAFRVVSLVFAAAPSQLRLQLLADLVAKCEYPQMRVAAVSVVKDAVLDALDSKCSNNVFATSMFMRVFGPLLFRPSPPDLFDQGTKLDLEEFLESPEPKRITEVLSLYYVALLRDKANMVSGFFVNHVHPLRDLIIDWDQRQGYVEDCGKELTEPAWKLARIDLWKKCRRWAISDSSLPLMLNHLRRE